MSVSSETEPLFVKVAECLYRNRSSGTYFAPVERKGKQIRQSLKTKTANWPCDGYETSE
ncbi:MAG: hypothetical protein KDN22_02315 [Verrucomicrobiae bacterium]|nr:hypothetical protein [Verrucomicrobiae bacterium]